MAQQININEVVPPMLNMVVQVMPLKMIMGAMTMVMGGGMMAKTEKKKQYWWVVEYNTVLYSTENEPRQNNVIIHGPEGNAVDAMKLVKKSSYEKIVYHTFSTDTPSRTQAFSTFLDWLRGKRVNTTNIRQVDIMPDTSIITARAKRALAAADDAFWAQIASAFPEVKHGDMSPDEVVRFEEAERNAVATWLRNNHPKFDSVDLPAGFVDKIVQEMR